MWSPFVYNDLMGSITDMNWQLVYMHRNKILYILNMDYTGAPRRMSACTFAIVAVDLTSNVISILY